MLRALIIGLVLWPQVSEAWQTSPDKPPETTGRLANREPDLRTLYYRGDEVLIRRDGPALATRKLASLETRAWYAAAKIIGPFTAEAPGTLEGMKIDGPDDPWTLVIESYVTHDPEQSAALCERIWSKDSREDLIVLCTAGVRLQVQNAAQAPKLRPFLERNKAKLETSAATLVVQAEALLAIGFRGWDKQASDDAAALFDRALRADPKNIRALLGKVGMLTNKKQYKEANGLLVSSPWAKESQAWHDKYSQTITQLEAPTKPERAALLDSDGRDWISGSEPVPSYLSHLVDSFYALDAPDRAAAAIDLVVQRYPDSGAAECALALRSIAELGKERNAENISPELRSEVWGSILEYLKRPVKSEGEDALWPTLGGVLKSGQPDAEDLLAALNGLDYDNGASIANLLACRKWRLPELERIATARIDQMVRIAGEMSAVWATEARNTDVRYYWANLAEWYAALGYAQLKQGRLPEAESSLTAAERLLKLPILPLDLVPGKTFLDFDATTLMYLGALNTAQGQYAKAEDYLQRSMASYYPGKEEHPAIAAFKELYTRRNGEAGLDAYMAGVYDKDRANRKQRTLAKRLAKPEPIEPFQLKSLDGKMVSSADLKGKLAVINFWGAWCSPCRAEMPELQEFYLKYKNDPNIAVLTIDEGDSEQEARGYLEKNRFTFPALMQSDYSVKAGVKAYPTTWFLDRDGRKVFEQVGSSQHLLEEFTWLLEGMTESHPPKK
jgi:thiol-disulfide isomerase/thioredoxin